MEPEHEVEPEPPIVVVDHGTRFTKFGLSTDSAPQKVRSVVGYPKRNVADSVRFKESYVGDEAMSFRHAGLLDLKHPYRDGKIQSFEDIEIIWLHIFKVLKLTGLVVDSGEAYTYVTAVYRGHALQDRVLPIPLAGARVTDFLENLLLEQEHVLPKEVLYGFKEKHSNVASSPQEAVSNTETVSDHLSDGQAIVFENGVFTKGPEVLFEPNLGGVACSGLHKVACELIQQCPEDVRKDLFGHIVLSGGNTLIRGFPARFEKEIKDEYSQLGGKIEDIIVVAPSERDLGAWKGAVEVTKMSNFLEQCINEYDYDVECEAVEQYKHDYGTSQSEATSSGA
ncbi:ARP1 actin-related protein 1-like protein A [Tanacetum coccineum]